MPQYPGICQGPHLIFLSAIREVPIVEVKGNVAPPQRRYNKRLIATRYDVCKLDTESETRSLKAVEDPRMMRESSNEMSVVTRIDRIGRAVLAST